MRLGWPQSIPLGTARANGAGMNETHDLEFLFFLGGCSFSLTLFPLLFEVYMFHLHTQIISQATKA